MHATPQGLALLADARALFVGGLSSPSPSDSLNGIQEHNRHKLSEEHTAHVLSTATCQVLTILRFALRRSEIEL